MIGGELITAIICDIIANVAAGEIKEVLDRLLRGEEIQSLVEDGNVAATSLQTGLFEAGIDAATLSSADWAVFGEIALAQQDGGWDEGAASGTGADPSQPLDFG